LGLMPDQLLSLTLPQYFDMVNAKLIHTYMAEDKEMERTAWSTSLLMSASGNYGKKGIEPKKLYERQYDDLGNPLHSEQQGTFTPIDREIKESKLNELLEQFNKE
jgi:hypothetical protein